MQLRQWIPAAGLALSVLAGAAVAQATPALSVGTQGRVPLVAAVATLPQPPGVWQSFYELTQIARPSRHEAKATAFMLAFKNGIPRATSVELALPTQQAAALSTYVGSFQASAAKELAASDPGLRIRVTTIPIPPKLLPLASQQALLKAVLDAPQGVDRMSAVLPDLVETSGNVGILNIGDGKMTAVIYVRSAKDSERNALAQHFVKVFEQGGASAVTSGAFASWPPKPDSPVLALMHQQYKTLFAKEANLVAATLVQIK